MWKIFGGKSLKFTLPEENQTNKKIEIQNRKKRVKELFFKGFSQEQIAEKLVTSPKTIYRDFKEIKKESAEWMEALPKGEIQLYFKSVFESINKSISEMWNLYEKTKDEKLKLNILKTLSEKSKIRADLLDPNRLLHIRNLIHKELSPPVPFSQNIFDNERRLIDYDKIFELDKS